MYIAVIPASFTIEANIIQSHGSSGASSICPIPNQMCTDPTGSSLFDGIIPELTGLATDMWAEHLVVLSPLNSDIRLKFDFRLQMR